MLGILH